MRKGYNPAAAIMGDVSMKQDQISDTEGQLSMALDRMQEALRLLDEAGAPGDIGSFLDLAIARLDARLGGGPRLAEAALLLSSLETVHGR